MTAAALEVLASLPRLRELTLRFGEDPLPSLQAFARAPALESLVLQGPLSEEHLREIGTFPGLRVLSLDKVPASERGLAAIAELSQLEELQLKGESDGTTALRKLAALPRLTRLDVQSLTMAPETARAVKAACPPWVECLVPDSGS